MLGYRSITRCFRVVTGMQLLGASMMKKFISSGRCLCVKVDCFATGSSLDFGKTNSSMLPRLHFNKGSLSSISNSSICVNPPAIIFRSSPAERRWFSTTPVRKEKLTHDQVRKRVEELTDRFAEARELLGDARESLGSTYFSDDMVDAQEAVSTTIDMYNALLDDLDEDQRNDVVRTIGLRMEELKAQEQAIKDLLD